MIQSDNSAKSLPGRPHDLVSYSGALIVFLAVAIWRDNKIAAHAFGMNLRDVGLVLWSMHFVRRLVECILVHRYAGRRVPVADAVGEYAYYWGFAAWNAWALSAPASSPSVAFTLIGTTLFAAGEFGNSWAHRKLRALRAPGTNDRGIPRGGLFELVSCPNYTYECVAWFGFTVATQTFAALVFFAGVVVILASWARKRQARYHALFDGKDGRPLYPAKRRALIPWVLGVL